MPSYQENYSVAVKLMRKIKSTIIASQDIVDLTKVPPALSTEQKTEWIRKNYGDETVLHLSMQRQFLDSARKIIWALSKKYSSPQTISYLATGMLGVGECSELNLTVQLTLLKLRRTDYCLVQIDNGVSLPNPAADGHYICFLGLTAEQSLNFQKNPDLKKLPESCVVIDLLYSHIGHANTLFTDLKNAYQCYGFHRISQVNRFSDEIVDGIDKIEEIARTVAQKTQMISPINKSMLSRNQSFLFFDLPTRIKNRAYDDFYPETGIVSGVPEVTFDEVIHHPKPCFAGESIALVYSDMSRLDLDGNNETPVRLRPRP